MTPANPGSFFMPKSNLTALCVAQERPASRRRQCDRRKMPMEYGSGNEISTTRTRPPDLMDTIISDFSRPVLSFVAHGEWENKWERQAEYRCRQGRRSSGYEPQPLLQYFLRRCKQWMEKGSICVQGRETLREDPLNVLFHDRTVVYEKDA